MAVALPEGFVLDAPTGGLPEGFVLDTPQSTSFSGRIKQDYANRLRKGENIAEEYVAGKQSYPETAAQFAGQGAAFGSDVLTEGLKSIGKGISNVTPDFIEEPIKQGAKYGLDYVSSSPVGRATAKGANYAVQKYGDFAEEYPRAARNVEAATNIGLSVAPSVRVGGKSAASAVESVAKKGVGATGAVINKVASEAPTLTSAQRKIYSSALFDEAAAKGGVLKSDVWDVIEKKVEASLPHEMSLDPSPSVFTGMKELVKANKGKPITLDGVEAMDKSLTTLISKEYQAVKGASPEAIKLQELQSEIRDLAYNPERGMVDGGDNGFKAYQEAVKEWSVAKKKEDIENILQRATFTDNPSTSIKKQFAALYMDKKRIRGYSEEQRAFIKKAGESSKFADFLRTTAGSRLIGSMLGGIAGGVAGGGVGAIPGAIGGAITGSAARGAATSLKKGQVRKLEKSIGKDSGANAIPRDVYKLPPDEAKEAIRKLRQDSQPVIGEIVSDVPRGIRSLPAPRKEPTIYGTRPDNYRRVGSGDIVTPPPPKTLSLPSPEPVTAVSRQGEARLMTPGERQAAEAARINSVETGLTPDVRRAQITNQQNQAYKQLEQQRAKTKEEQLIELLKQSQPSVPDMITVSKKKAAELAKALGKSPEASSIGKALERAALIKALNKK